jgi:hypothetical protein
MKQLLVLVATAAALAVPLCAPAAEAAAPTDPSQPVTTPRVGGSTADKAFRESMNKSGADFRAARTACRAKPKAERSACLHTAHENYNTARDEATATHNAARAEANAAHAAALEEKKQAKKAKQAAKP